MGLGIGHPANLALEGCVLRKLPFFLSWLALLSVGVGMTPANAILFSGNGLISGNAVSATVEFLNPSADVLTILLRNTSPGNLLEAPTNTLSGISFTINGLDPLLTPVSAAASLGIFHPSGCDASPCGGIPQDIGGEWGYQNAYGSGLEAIASAGYITTGLVGNLGNFGGLNLGNPASLDGINFGILSIDHGALNGGNGGLIGQPLVWSEAFFTLTGFDAFLGEIGDVTFLYGTAPDGTTDGTCTGCGNPPPVSEPSTIAVFGVGLLALALASKRRRKLQQA